MSDKSEEVVVEPTQEDVPQTEEQLLEEAQKMVLDSDDSEGEGDEGTGADSDAVDSSGSPEPGESAQPGDGEPDKKAVGEGEAEGGKEPAEGAGEEPEKPEQPERLSKKLALVSKKERELKNKEKDILSREESVKEREKFFDELDKNPIEALESKFGKKLYEEMTYYYLDKEKYQAKAQGERIEKRLDERESEEKKRKEQEVIDAQLRAADEYFGEIRNAAKDSRFELINARGLQEEAVEYAKLYYEKHEVVLQPEDAAAAIEEYLKEDLKSSLETKYGKSLLGEPAEPEEPAADERPEQNPTKNTLDNKLQTTPAPKGAPQELSEEELFEEAERELNKQLSH